MVPAATLKAFEPLTAFEASEREYWQRYVQGSTQPPADSVLLSREHGLAAPTATLVAEAEHADVIERRGHLLICPHRTRLRLLASVVAFRRSIPAEALAAFMPRGEVERAAEAIDEIRNAHPRWRNHILESAWEVPLHWFVAFDDSERQYADDPKAPRIVYETVMRAARERCARVLSVVRSTLPNPAVIAPVAGMARWLEDFDPTSLLVLDYGGVGGLMPRQDLRADRTCRQIWEAVKALTEGDGDRAAAHYMVAAERWSRVRRRESWN